MWGMQQYMHLAKLTLKLWSKCHMIMYFLKRFESVVFKMKSSIADMWDTSHETHWGTGWRSVRPLKVFLMGVEGCIIWCISQWINHTKAFLDCTETTALCRLNVSFRWTSHLECWHKPCHSVPICSDVSPLIDTLYWCV